MTESNIDSILPVLIAGARLPGLFLVAAPTYRRIPFFLFEAGPCHDHRQDYGITLRQWAYEPLPRALGEIDTKTAIGSFKRSVAVDALIGGIGRIEVGSHGCEHRGDPCA